MFDNRIWNHLTSMGYAVPDKKEIATEYVLYKQLPENVTKKVKRTYTDRKEAFKQAQVLANRYYCTYFVSCQSKDHGTTVHDVEPNHFDYIAVGSK